MVSIFMVHPNLRLTRCDTSSVSQIAQYQNHLRTGITELNRAVINAEIQYLSSYARILDIMHRYFSKPVLTFEDESKGLDLIATEMETFKQSEDQLACLKKQQGTGNSISSASNSSNPRTCAREQRSLDVISEE